MSLRVGTAVVAIIGLGLFTWSLMTQVTELVGMPEATYQPQFTAYQQIEAAEEGLADPELQLLVIREAIEPEIDPAIWFDDAAAMPLAVAQTHPPFRVSIENGFAAEHSQKEAGI